MQFKNCSSHYNLTAHFHSEHHFCPSIFNVTFRFCILNILSFLTSLPSISTYFLQIDFQKSNRSCFWRSNMFETRSTWYNFSQSLQVEANFMCSIVTVNKWSFLLIQLVYWTKWWRLGRTFKNLIFTPNADTIKHNLQCFEHFRLKW